MPNSSEKTKKLEQFQRNNYFYGKLMTVKDFQKEQEYFNNKRHLINRLVNGIGHVRGLNVTSVVLGQNSVWEANLSEGVAIDENGYEIIVPFGKSYPIKGKFPSNEDKIALFIQHKDEEREDVSTTLTGSTCEESCQKNRIKEDFELVFDNVPEIPPDVDYNISKISESDRLRVAEQYYRVRDSKYGYIDCLTKEKPKALLAILNKTSDPSKLEPDIDETIKKRQIVFNNVMLYDILTKHMANKNNPHDLDAVKIGAIRSIQKIYDPDISLKSDSLNFFTEKSEEGRKHGLSSNELKIELKNQNFMVRSGEIEITKYSEKKIQFFGPVEFETEYSVPPLVILSKVTESNNVRFIEYLEDYVPNFLQQDTNVPIKQENQINFKAAKVTTENFSIAIENISEKPSTNSLFLRYWIIPSSGTEIKTKKLPYEGSTINVEPKYAHTDTIKLIVTDDEKSSDTLQVNVASKISGNQGVKTLNRIHKDFSQFQVEFTVSEFTSLPGDVITISYGTLSKDTKILPVLKFNESIYNNLYEPLKLTLVDYSARQQPSVNINLKIGKNDPREIQMMKSPDNTRSTFSFEMEFEKLQTAFKKDYDVDILGRGKGMSAEYKFKIDTTEQSVFASSVILIPSFTYDHGNRKDRRGRWDRDLNLIRFTIYDSTMMHKTDVEIHVRGILSDGTATDFIPATLSKEEVRRTKEFRFRDQFRLSEWLGPGFGRRTIYDIKKLEAQYRYFRKEKDTEKEHTVNLDFEIPN